MKSLHLPTRSSLVQFTCAVIMALATIAKAQTLQCVETNGIKVFWPPNIDGGWDVKDSRQNIVLADDFPCNTTGPITDIHLWGSWLSNNHGTVTNFWIGIYDDVPAVTNFSSGQITTNSHPGTNLLWQQSFGPGQYSEQLAGTGSESFFDPSVPSIIGTDTAAYYYCFYPTNPFVQQGSSARPTNYWLAVRAQLPNDETLFGWKTSLVSYNDPAVWGTVLATTGLPIGNWKSMTNVQNFQPINLAFKLTTPTNSPPPTPCCPETNGVKYLQRPNLNNGIDIDVSDNFVLADDFPCTNTGPITDIHLWGSWLFNNEDFLGASYKLTIWSDVPVGPGNNFSHPGTNLWSQTFGPGQYSVCPYANVQENFEYNNAAGLNVIGTSTNLYYLCFFMDPANTFSQTGTPNAPTNYWLSVSVQSTVGAGKSFGWKTSADRYHDVAVWGTAPLPPPTGWNPMSDFFGNTYDLAFKITTQTNPPVATGCVETNGVKYVQWPNVNNGSDVWNSSTVPAGVTDGPWVLADDFICTNTGPITDIHIWGSWWYDFVATNSITFWLGLYDDVPANPPSSNFSHPGNLVWQQYFAPGQYSDTFWSFGQETFLDPGPPQIVGTDTQVRYYCFYPTNPPTQFGSAAAPKTYWLAAYAQLPAGDNRVYGWKTTTDVQHDISVHAPWPGSSPPNNWPWTPTSLPTGLPLDLAFKLTTPTNTCPTTFVCQPDQTVECGSAWSFSPPGVFPSACCPVAGLPTLIGVVTNESDPCKKTYTASWQITNCLGSIVGNCSQTVTVVDTTPPTITCPANIVILTCDTNATIVTWSIAATDTCSSVTVTSSPPSGTAFLPNTTNTVTATARDACGNTGSCTFTVMVRRPVLGPIFINTVATNKVVLTWTNGILQVTTNLLVPFVDVPGATSPYTNTALPMPPTNRFYRLRCSSP